MGLRSPTVHSSADVEYLGRRSKNIHIHINIYMYTYLYMYVCMYTHMYNYSLMYSTAQMSSEEGFIAQPFPY